MAENSTLNSGEFYRSIGYGEFLPSRYGGEFPGRPRQLIRGAGPAVYFITGSLTPGAEWATEEATQETLAFTWPRKSRPKAVHR